MLSRYAHTQGGPVDVTDMTPLIVRNSDNDVVHPSVLGAAAAAALSPTIMLDSASSSAAHDPVRDNYNESSNSNDSSSGSSNIHSNSNSSSTSAALDGAQLPAFFLINASSDFGLEQDAAHFRDVLAARGARVSLTVIQRTNHASIAHSIERHEGADMMTGFVARTALSYYSKKQSQ